MGELERAAPQVKRLMSRQGARSLAYVFLFIASPLLHADALDDFEMLANIADEDYRPVIDVAALEHPPFEHDKTLRIEPGNLDDPWVSNVQCHANFPLFPDLQIAFREGAVRAMRITRRENVVDAWIDGPTVQMKQTRPETRLCFESENRVFKYDPVTDIYVLRVGPYFLSLFDGYFPLHVRLRVSYPDELLELMAVSPDPISARHM